MDFTAEFGKVRRRERKEIQLSFVLIVLNDKRPSEAKFRSFRLNLICSSAGTEVNPRTRETVAKPVKDF
jgi:hypothetical protein